MIITRTTMIMIMIRITIPAIVTTEAANIRIAEAPMTLTIERDGPVTTIIRSRIEARNAMDPASAEALTEAFLAFDRDDSQSVAVLWGAGGAFCAGFDLKYAASQLGEKNPMAALDFPVGEGAVPRGPMGPTRL